MMRYSISSILFFTSSGKRGSVFLSSPFAYLTLFSPSSCLIDRRRGSAPILGIPIQANQTRFLQRAVLIPEDAQTAGVSLEMVSHFERELTPSSDEASAEVAVRDEDDVLWFASSFRVLHELCARRGGIGEEGCRRGGTGMFGKFGAKECDQQREGRKCRKEMKCFPTRRWAGERGGSKKEIIPSARRLIMDGKIMGMKGRLEKSSRAGPEEKGIDGTN